MGIKINITGTEISGTARVLNNAEVRGDKDIEIELKNTKISENAMVLENLKIDSILDEVYQKVAIMDKNSEEYPQLQEILSLDRWNKKELAQRMAIHISNFAQGVLASVLANYLTMK